MVDRKPAPPPPAPITLRTWSDVGTALVRILKRDGWSFACENTDFATEWLGDNLLPLVVSAAQARWHRAGLPDLAASFLPSTEAQVRCVLDPAAPPRHAALWLLLAIDVLTVPDSGAIPSMTVAPVSPRRVDVTPLWNAHHRAVATGELFALTSSPTTAPAWQPASPAPRPATSPDHASRA